MFTIIESVNKVGLNATERIFIVLNNKQTACLAEEVLSRWWVATVIRILCNDSACEATKSLRVSEAQYTPPTPTRRNCRVESRRRRRCKHNIRKLTTADGFGRQFGN